MEKSDIDNIHNSIIEEVNLYYERENNNNKQLAEIIKNYKCKCNIKNTLIPDEKYNLICQNCKTEATYE